MAGRERKTGPETYLTSPRLERTFIEMWESGKTYDHIGLTLQIPKGSVRKIAGELGLKMRVRGRPQKPDRGEGRTVQEFRDIRRAAQTDFMRRRAMKERGIGISIHTRPTSSLFGAPIRDLSPEDRKLIRKYQRGQKSTK